MSDLTKLGYGFVLKTQERTVKGIPDLLACFKGKFIAIELKVDGEEATPIQKYRIKQIVKAGGLAFVTTPTEWPVHLEIIKSALERL